MTNSSHDSRRSRGWFRWSLAPLLVLLAATSVATGAETYVYDDLGRVTRVERDNGVVITYEYDPAGNITRRTESCPDADGDSFCVTSDCDDSDARIYPGAPQVCDGVNNDCDEPGWPLLSELADNDGDGMAECAGDCDDRLASCTADCATDLDADGVADCADTCIDADLDHYGAAGGAGHTCPPADCDDTNPHCDADCTDADADGYCGLNDCLDSAATCTTDCSDLDGDATPDCNDCDDANPGATVPGVVESNDALDNQCPGETGHGLVDEISGECGFYDPADKTKLSWTPQAGATLYEVARADGGSFGGCQFATTPGAFWIDPEQPTEGEAYYYLVRSTTPHLGSWGADSADTERVLCDTTVTSLADSGLGSLRSVIDAAAPSATIVFAVAGTIGLTGGELVIDRDLTIDGPGAANLTIDGGNSSRVFNIVDGSVSIVGVTIANGQSNDGGGIRNGGDLTLMDSVVTGNTSSGNGGGLSNHGGSVTITRDTISGNSAGASGGGVYNASGTTTIELSTISGNTASSGYGGGLHLSAGVVNITASTISGNVAWYGGGVMQYPAGSVTLTSSTVAGNVGIYYSGIFAWSAALMTNTIVAGAAPVCYGPITSGDHNLSTDGTCGLNQPHDLPTTDPQLEPLADNGGPTLTHALAAAGPAIDAGPAVCGSIDQRGIARPQGSACDIGAYEAVDTEKTAFVTSTTYNGNLGGLSGADATCQLRASSAGLSGTFRAWLSDDSFSPITRLTHSTVPYVRVDGLPVADDWDDLVDGTLHNPINVAEDGSVITSGVGVWTAVLPDGSPIADNCTNWTDAVGFGGARGQCNFATGIWTWVGITSVCSQSFRIYCFEQ